MRNRSISRRLYDALPWAAGRFALLLLLLGGWLFSFRTLWELPMEDGRLLGWCVLLSLAAAGLWLLPQKLRWSLLGLTTAAGLLTLWRWEFMAPGLRELLIRAAAPLGELFPALSIPPADDSLAAILPACFLWLAVLMALLLGFLVSLRCWWAVMAVCFLPLLPSIFIGELPSWGGFLAMLGGVLPLLFTALFRQEEPRSLGWSSLLSLAMSLLLLLTLTAALPQDTYEYPQWAMDARNALLDLASGGLDSAMEWEIPWEVPSDQGGLSTPLLLYQGEQVDLAAAGPRHFTGRTVLEVEGTREGRVYLRGSSSSCYTGTSWEPIAEADYQDLLQALADPSGEDQVNALLYPAAYLNGQEAASLTIRHVALSNSVAYVPYQPALDTAQQLSLTRDTCFIRSSGQNRYTLSYYPDFLPGSAAASSDEKAVYRDFVYQHYLEVPDETAQLLAPLSARLGETAVQAPEGLAEDYRPAVTTALQTAQLLGKLAVYDLNAPAMAEGEDFVSHFLTEGRGYCVHFATTAALLLRMQGIPARYVSGYTALVTPGEAAKVPDSAAHAWVEIYLDGYGWYPVEVTPGGGESGAPASETEDPTLPEAGDEPAVDTPQTEPPAIPVQPWEDTTTSDTGDADADYEGSAPSAQPLDLRWLRIPAGILLLGALGYGLERLAARLRRREEKRPDTNPSVLSAYRRYRRLLALGAAEDPVLEELGRKAKFSQHTLTEEERSLAWQQLAATAGLDALSPLPWWKRLMVRLLSRY